jgi:two-component system, OmpR family, KDP operon response regulator KdpE
MSEPHPVKPTVLVIDDELQIRRLLRVSLEANGYQILEAANGQEGISEAAQHRPDVVLLDLGLPDMDGVTGLKRLREWSHVPVVVLSVRDREEDKIKALDNGADDYLTKPFGTPAKFSRTNRFSAKSGARTLIPKRSIWPTCARNLRPNLQHLLSC